MKPILIMSVQSIETVFDAGGTVPRDVMGAAKDGRVDIVTRWLDAPSDAGENAIAFHALSLNIYR